MTSTIQLNSDHTKIEVHLSGHVTGREVILINEDLMNHLDCFSQVWNFLEVKTFHVSAEELHKIALQDRTFSIHSNIKKLAIVGTNDILCDIDKSYEVISSSWVGRPNKFVSRTFGSMNEAYEWINCDEK